jgi:hypothetical protein
LWLLWSWSSKVVAVAAVVVREGETMGEKRVAVAVAEGVAAVAGVGAVGVGVAEVEVVGVAEVAGVGLGLLFFPQRTSPACSLVGEAGASCRSQTRRSYPVSNRIGQVAFRERNKGKCA